MAAGVAHNSEFLNSLFSPTSVVERELNVPLPLSKIIKKWNNLLQEYKVSYTHILSRAFLRGWCAVFSDEYDRKTKRVCMCIQVHKCTDKGFSST